MQLESEMRSEKEEVKEVEKREEVPKDQAAAVDAPEGSAPDPCGRLRCKDGTALRMSN